MVLAFVLGRCCEPLRWFEYEIDRLFDLIGQRLECDDAILSDGRGDRSDDMQAGAVAGDVETGFKSRQFPQAGDFRNGGAHERIGAKIEMLTGLGNLLNRDRNVPWRNRICRGGIWRLVLGHRNGLRVGKINSAAQQGLLILELKSARHSTHVTRQAARSSSIHTVKDITRQRLLKLPPVRRIEGGKIGGLSSVKRFGKLPHSFWNGQIPDAHFPQIGVEIPAKMIEQVLAKI